MIARILIACVLLVTALPVLAVNPDEMLADPALEARARELGKGLRCLVCQNQSIDESDAELARDMRVLVRDRIAAGDSNEQVMAYIVSRYGDFVLLNPPVKLKTYALWFGPVLMLLAGAGVVVVFYRRRSVAAASSPVQPLSAAEQAALDALMKDDRP